MKKCPYCGDRLVEHAVWLSASHALIEPDYCHDHGPIGPEDAAAAKRGSDHELAMAWRELAIAARARTDLSNSRPATTSGGGSYERP